MSHRIPSPTRESVLGAIARCDQLGVDRFLAVYGYRPSLRFVVRHAGRSYPSKAILGVASGLTARDFSGGAGHTCRVLARLGFTVRDGKPRGVDAEIARIALSVDWSTPPISTPDLPVDPACYFASGSNHPGEIRALADLGHDVGVCAKEIGPPAIHELLQLAGTDVQVFVDSGAFSERDRKTFELVRPMTERDWERVLSLYERLADVLGDQLHVVATDRVGCQTHTIELLLTYRLRLRALHARGVRVLMPVQKGSRRQADFYRRCCEILGFEPIPALPCAKAATTVDEARAFAETIQPRVVHLLGLGIRNPEAPAYLTAISEACGAHVQLDSALVPSLAGRTNGPGGGPRRLTAANDLALVLARSCAKLADVAARKYLGLVLALGGVGVLS